MQHLNSSGIGFDSMIVFQNMTEIPSQDLSRLTDAANDMISSLDENSDFGRKITKKLAWSC